MHVVLVCLEGIVEGSRRWTHAPLWGKRTFTSAVCQAGVCLWCYNPIL